MCKEENKCASINLKKYFEIHFFTNTAKKKQDVKYI